MADSTIFDSVFRTTVQKMPELVIPLINEAFGREYPDDVAFEQLRNEHEERGGRIITDSIFRVCDRVYHIECQSGSDSRMALRMIEYDFAIALEEALAGGAPYEINFPDSCVLYLRHGESTSDVLDMKLNLPSGESFLYQTRVVKAQDYTGDEIFAKRLLLLLPFYIMRYERQFDEIACSEAQSARLVEECARMRNLLVAETIDCDRADLYDQIVELTVRVSDYLLYAQAKLRKKVRAAMGGEILELMSDRIAAAEEEAAKRGERKGFEIGEQRGLEIGTQQGIEQGIERGIEQGIERMAASLRAFGVDEAAIQSAIRSAQEG